MTSQSHSATEALQKIPFFSQLAPQEATELAEQLAPRHFEANKVIFHHGDPGGLCYIITEGKVKIAHTTPEGQEALLAILGTGDFFGELALLDDFPRSATAEAIEPTETLTLHRDKFRRFLRHNPEFAFHVMQTLAKRIRHLNHQISDVFFLDLNGRLARILLHLADKHGRPTEEGTLIDIPLTQTDLAEMAGATRVSINKTLKHFRNFGWVRLEDRHVIVLNTLALQKLTNAPDS